MHIFVKKSMPPRSVKQEVAIRKLLGTPGQAPAYQHQPTTPAVLKVEKTENETILYLSAGKVAIRDNPAFDVPGESAYLVPTRANIVRFIQALWVEHTEPHESACPSEEDILAAYEKFFRVGPWPGGNTL